MKSSARNQFTGTINAMREGAVNDEIQLKVGGDLNIVATVTRESREALGLTVGAPAFALVKASSIILMTDTESIRLSTRNQFAGTVTRVVPGAVNTEVLLDVAGGISLAVIVTNESARSMDLAEGSAATAVFKASSVIIGVNA